MPLYEHYAIDIIDYAIIDIITPFNITPLLAISH
jgi:hypothetical protein